MLFLQKITAFISILLLCFTTIGWQEIVHNDEFTHRYCFEHQKLEHTSPENGAGESDNSSQKIVVKEGSVQRQVHEDCYFLHIQSTHLAFQVRVVELARTFATQQPHILLHNKRIQQLSVLFYSPSVSPPHFDA